ncbi:MAG: hypothetical protein C5B60_07415 [Chloroflexi bacterium]|nr:MAG: hypothetical protein C5B60_07415 [Chloroflexota bacterium]
MLLEICFVDSRADATLYREHFEAICCATAESITGRIISIPPTPQPPPVQPPAPPPPTPSPPVQPLPPQQVQRPTLRTGSRGEDVRELQQLLNRHGASPPLIVDGSFGPRTDVAVRAFQNRRSLVVDGIVGPRTWAALTS